jgi:hypothetical protein
VPSLLHPTNQGWNWGLINTVAGRYTPVLACYILQTKGGVEGQCPGRAFRAGPSLLHTTIQEWSWGWVGCVIASVGWLLETAPNPHWVSCQVSEFITLVTEKSTPQFW